MTFREIIVKLAEDAGVKGGYPEDADGVVRLVFDDDCYLGLMELESDGTMLMWSPIAELPQTGEAKLPVELLKANYFGRASAGGTLSMSDEGVVFIHCQISLSATEYADFRRRLEGLIVTASEWRRLIEACRAGGGTPVDESVPMRNLSELKGIEFGGFIRV